MKRLSMRAFIRERIHQGDLVTIDGETVSPGVSLDSYSDDDLKRAVFHGLALKKRRAS